MTERTIEELRAGDAFRQTLIAKADVDRSGAPLWHGWALMGAFLAGMDYERQKRINGEPHL